MSPPEEKHPEAAAILCALAEAPAQQDPTFRTTVAFTRLTAAEALKRLRARGVAEAKLPSPSTLTVVLNRHGYRLRPVLKAKPQKNCHKPTRSSTTSPPTTRPLTTTGMSCA